MKTGKLYLIPCSLDDRAPDRFIPQEVKIVVSQLRQFIVENEKTARRFIKAVSPQTSQQELIIHVMNKHDPDSGIEKFLEPAVQGNDMGLMSEAGCPSIADPGAVIVAAAQRKNISVVPLSGPSSVVLALMASGLSGQRFCFHGYLPINDEELKARLLILEKDSHKKEEAQIFIETPYRNDRLLNTLLRVLSGTTLLCVAIGITTEEERIRTMTISGWKKLKIGIGKVPAVFIIQKK